MPELNSAKSLIILSPRTPASPWMIKKLHCGQTPSDILHTEKIMLMSYHRER